MTLTASLQRVAEQPPTFILRCHPGPGTWQDRSEYFGSATVSVYGTIAVLRGLTLPPGHSRSVRAAILAAAKREGVLVLIGAHGPRHELMIWPVT